MAAEPPKKIGPYQILRKIGEGGMGAVFEGVHELIERKVAIKVLHPEYAQRPEFISRFFNEARAVNRIDHPGLVAISDYGQLPDNTAYIVMELLNGESLSSRMKKNGAPLGLDQVLNYGYQLSEALAAAHEKGVVHRDLKPDNVMIVPDAHAPGGERTKLLDFGIAKLSDEGGPVDVKTNTNAVIGTIYYMSPEQCRGAGKVDHRSDVYSLGVMLYEMLSGERPITGEGQGDILVKHLTEEPAPLASKVPQVPEAVATLVHRMMIKNRDQRPTMQEVAGELETLSALAPPQVRRRSSMSMRIVAIDPTSRPGPTTLGNTAAGQANPNTATGMVDAAKTRTRNMIFGAVAGSALLVSVGLGLHFGRQRAHQPDPATQVAAASARLRIDSSPPGAEVVVAADGRVLGKTPWTTEQPAAPGMLKVRLRLPGYAEKELEIDQSKDVVRSEALVALSETKPATKPTAEPTAEPTDSDGTKSGLKGKGGKGAKATPAGVKRPKHKGKVGILKGGRHIED